LDKNLLQLNTIQQQVNGPGNICCQETSVGIFRFGNKMFTCNFVSTNLEDYCDSFVSTN